MQSLSPHRVVALAYPGMSPFELGVVVEVFGLPRPELDVPAWYRLHGFAVRPGAQPAVGGISIDVQHGLEILADADTIVVPGWPVADAVPAALLEAIRSAGARGARRGGGERRAAGLDLLRSLRPRGRGSARRAPGRYPLAVRGAACP